MKTLKINRNSPGNEDNHYSGYYQPIDYIELYCTGGGLRFTEGCIVKYVSRHKSKGGKEDVKKVVWYLRLLKQRVHDGRFRIQEDESPITQDEYVKAQQLGEHEEQVFRNLMDFLHKGDEVYLDTSISAAVSLLRWYEHTDEDVDAFFSGDGEPVKLVSYLIEDQIYECSPSPWGKTSPVKYHLDVERRSKTVKFQATGEDGVSFGYFTVGLFADGSPGEVFIDGFGKEGGELHGWADSWAVAVSMLLQYGVDPRKIYDKFSHMQFEPAGITGVSSVPISKSVVDLIVRWMERNLAPTAEKDPTFDSYDEAIDLMTEKAE